MRCAASSCSWCAVRSPSRGDDGSVTAEFAIVMPAIVFVLALCLSALGIAGHQVRVVDAAAMAARTLGRGETTAVASAVVARLVPGAVLARLRNGDLECATVSSTVPLGLVLTATSCALGGGR